MSLFQCQVCGCCENTALSSQGCKGWFEKLFDWSYAPERKGLLLCSVCAPTHFRDGEKTKFGVWHNEFEQTFLPMREFHTNSRGNLEHTETGDEDFMKFEIKK